jgi:hypothetical protein
MRLIIIVQVRAQPRDADVRPWWAPPQEHSLNTHGADGPAGLILAAAIIKGQEPVQLPDVLVWTVKHKHTEHLIGGVLVMVIIVQDIVWTVMYIWSI